MLYLSRRSRKVQKRNHQSRSRSRNNGLSSTAKASGAAMCDLPDRPASIVTQHHRQSVDRPRAYTQPSRLPLSRSRCMHLCKSLDAGCQTSLQSDRRHCLVPDCNGDASCLECFTTKTLVNNMFDVVEAWIHCRSGQRYRYALAFGCSRSSVSLQHSLPAPSKVRVKDGSALVR
eukprot:4008879-Pyramimonas_sp.AAC.1